jgi:serine/threonine-protein kinase
MLPQDPPGSAAAAGAGDAAAAGQSLVGQQLCLKVCRRYSCVPEILQKKLYGDGNAYFRDMRDNLLQHHTIMQQCGGDYVLRSHLFGYIHGEEGARVPALLMDRAEGGNVAEKLQHGPSLFRGARPGLGSKTTHGVVQGVVCGLLDIHEAGYAHLDIKPANIVSRRLGTEPGGEPFTQYYLIDFGSSVRVGAGGYTTATIPGTLPYMAPEWLHDQVVSYQADIWAVGVLLLELRTGHKLSDSHAQGLIDKSSHNSTLQDMRQSAYSILTDGEWECVTACLAYERTARPDAESLLSLDYIVVGAE